MTAAMVKRIGLVAGPLLGLVCYYLLPLHYSNGAGEWVEFTQAGRATLGLMVWMATWWITEAVDIEVTALLPIATFPLFGIAPLNKVLPPYAADVIFLFMGGFIIGLAIERWGLDRRIAFFTLGVGRRAPGRDRRRLHGSHRLPEHVGFEYRVRSHDGADRIERH